MSQKTVDPVLSARAALARAHRPRIGKPNTTEAEFDALRRNLTAAKCARAIREALDAKPRLTAAQRAELAGLLIGGAK